MTIKQRQLIGISLVALSAGLVLFWFDPAKSSFYPPCLFHSLTGFYCPGCGSTRALHQLLQGRIRAALDLNPLLLLVLPLTGYLLVEPGYHFLTGRTLRPGGKGLPVVWILVLLAVVVIFAVARNIRLYPFNVLAP